MHSPIDLGHAALLFWIAVVVLPTVGVLIQRAYEAAWNPYLRALVCCTLTLAGLVAAFVLLGTGVLLIW